MNNKVSSRRVVSAVKSSFAGVINVHVRDGKIYISQWKNREYPVNEYITLGAKALRVFLSPFSNVFPIEPANLPDVTIMTSNCTSRNYNMVGNEATESPNRRQRIGDDHGAPYGSPRSLKVC